MGGIQANWHLNLAATYDDDDPFSEQLRIEEVGNVIDLSATHAVVQEELAVLLRQEGDLWNAGVVCQIKQDFRDTTCSACPVRRHDEEDPLHALCEVGVRQERALTLIRVRQLADGEPPAS